MEHQKNLEMLKSHADALTGGGFAVDHSLDKHDMLKSHIDAYTRADGTVVQAHEDGRQKKAPKFNEPGYADYEAQRNTLYDNDKESLGSHKVGDIVSFKNERGVKVTGKVKGARDGGVVVARKAGGTYSMHHHSELSPEKGDW